MELRHVHTFRAVARSLNFTKAAERLNLAQSSVSAQIKSLEEELGVKLFDRIGRRVLLTTAGEKLSEYARRMEEMTNEIVSEISGATDTKGSLTIRTPETLATVYCPEIVRLFHNRYPMVRLDFINCTDRQLREELNSGRIDLAFLMTDEVAIPEVKVRALRTEPLVMVAGPGNPLTVRKKVATEDLKDQTILLPRTD
jgi:DNA-binding transcriptional LysR family regulator